MPNYDNINIISGMLARFDGAMWEVLSVNGDVVVGRNLDTSEERIFSGSTIKSMASGNEIWVAWPPNLRQENMS